MESEAAINPVGGDDPLDIQTLLAQIPDDCNMEDFLLDESGGHAPPDLQSAGDTSRHSTIAGLHQAVMYPLGLGWAVPTAAAATGAGILSEYEPVPAGIEILHQQSAHMEWCWPGVNMNPGPIQTHREPPCSAGGTGTGTEELIMPPPYSAGEPRAFFTATGTEEEDIVQSGSALLGFNMQEVNAALNPAAAAAAVQDILSVEGAGDARREPNRVLVNASLTQPDRYSSYSAGGDSTGPSTTTTEMGISSPDLEVVNNRARAGLSQPGGGAFTFTEAPAAERGSSSKRKCLEADLVRSDPSSSSADINSPTATGSTDERSTNIKPPDNSTLTEIIQFLKRERPKLCRTQDVVNRSLAEQDQTAPKTHRRYVTTMRIMSERRTHQGYWKEKDSELVKMKTEGRKEAQITIRHVLQDLIGIKRTFRFHTINNEETNWSMHEYISLDRWGIDMYFQDLCFRDVHQVAGKQRVNTNNRTTAAVKHRMRGPEDLKVVKGGESAAWNHFIKIYDMHPQLEGSKLVYAVCCHCEGVLKAGTENGTKSLLTHCQRTCLVIKRARN